MKLPNRSMRAGTYAVVVAASALCLGAAGESEAEIVKTVNGAAIDSAVLDAYIENRVDKPIDQVTAEEREVLTNELTDIYLLSTQESTERLEQDPQVAAQIELQKRGVLAQAAAEQFFAENAVSEEEILAEYQEQVKLAPPLQFKARHILVPTQAVAEDVIRRLDEGADFQEVAKEKSTGPSGPKGGELGWFSPDQMVKPFSDAVANLEDGSYTKQPVQTQFGWHVILREESRENQPPTLASVRDSVTQSIQQKKFQAHLEQLRATSNTEN